MQNTLFIITLKARGKDGASRIYRCEMPSASIDCEINIMSEPLSSKPRAKGHQVAGDGWIVFSSAVYNTLPSGICVCIHR